MDALGKVKAWIGGLTEIGLMLLALAIVAALLEHDVFIRKHTLSF
jgi:hypothetical protein